ITWSDTLLPALTTANGGRYRRASDPVVGYDARHGTWLVSDIAIVTEDTTDLTVSRSADARTWQPPVKVAGDGKMFYDKDWIACDNSAASPWYGTCYLESDVFSDPNADYGEVVMNRSTDGGLTWSPPVAAADRALGLGGQPMVRPDGTAVVPYVAPNSEVRAIRSADGGASWTASVRVSDVQAHRPAGGLRTGPSLPSADVDAAGRLYLAWMDCRFRSGCPGNDIVY